MAMGGSSRRAEQDEPFTIRLKVQKLGDRMIVDFDGTDPQVPGPMNAPLSVTSSGVFAALKMSLDSKGVVPPNSGAWRPVEVRAPAGTVVNAQFPAPVVYANHEISHRVCDMVFGALTEIVPEQVMACSQGTSAVLTLGGVDYRNGERYVSYETIKGGFGARPNKDGISAVASGISNTMNTPIEVLEMSFPVRVEHYELIPDSGGAGRRPSKTAHRPHFWTSVSDQTQQSGHSNVICQGPKTGQNLAKKRF